MSRQRDVQRPHDDDDSTAYDINYQQQPDVPTTTTTTLTLRHKLHRVCNTKLLKKRLPIVDWLPKYRTDYLLSDFVAGVTVALTAIPQGIAYAVVAGLEPQYGLYSGFMGCFMYFIFGSCKDITIGPTAIMALMVQKYTGQSTDFAVLSAFLSGLVIMMLGLLNLGFLIEFISTPVTAGFTSAAALTIASGQIVSLLGMPGKANEFVTSWINIIKNITKVQLWDSVLGITTIVMLFVLQRVKDHRGPAQVLCKYLSLSRNALAIIFGICLAYVCTVIEGSSPVTLTGRVDAGLPDFKPPPFSTTINNSTVLDFSQMLSTLGTSVVAIPLISILESIAIAKAFSPGKTIDATQEMIALGVCNIAGSFVSSMPTTGSFTRTAVNNSSGVRTTLGGLFTGALILLALSFFTRAFYFIPKTSLAAVIVSAMFYMVDVGTAKEIWRTRRIDIIPFIVTLIACLLLGLEYGIVIGVTTHILFCLYHISRPDVSIELVKVNNVETLLITPQQNLMFSAADFINYKIIKAVNTYGNATRSFIIINGQFVQRIDMTVIKYLDTTVNSLKALNKEVIFWNWTQQPTQCATNFNPNFGKHFRNADTLDDLMQQLTKAGIAQQINEFP